jgi:hypothetical protein
MGVSDIRVYSGCSCGVEQVAYEGNGRKVVGANISNNKVYYIEWQTLETGHASGGLVMVGWALLTQHGEWSLKS